MWESSLRKKRRVVARQTDGDEAAQLWTSRRPVQARTPESAIHEGMPPEPDETGPEPEPGDIFPEDVRAQLRAAAVSLAELVGGDVGRAEQAMFDSALELTRNATVLQYAPLLASRRARRQLRDAQDQD